MSNFQFLAKEWPSVYENARQAEDLTKTYPQACVVLCRSALEKTVLWLYANDPDLQTPYQETLSALLFEQCFQDILPGDIFREIDLIRRLGNNAAHGRRTSSRESLICVKNLFRFLGFVAALYAEKEPESRSFDESLIPDKKEEEGTRQRILELEEKLEEERQKQREELDCMQRKLEEQEKELKERKTIRQRSFSVEEVFPRLVSESETRRLYIDLMLEESGWTEEDRSLSKEHLVTGMPSSTNPGGKGYVDYVLWGSNGLPLAVVEAKRAISNVYQGKHQAELYADCLEKSEGQRPFIFYTNGFETYLWDDQFYVEREVEGFYSQDELQLLLDRRKSRQDLRSYQACREIVDRPYQLEAIKRVAESFVLSDAQGNLRGKSRHSLLIMATGSGKTRTAVAIVDMLTKCDWAKRVLFLADRKALVIQAKNAFQELLPHLSAINLVQEKEDPGTRLVFSTYQTIMNKIDTLREGKKRFYGVGHFDLIIIDEAHRSVYHKYHAIFDYFDSLLIGLTATPKKDIDRNTYSLFGIEDDNPTFAYELDVAVAEGYLVPPKVISVPLKFTREGVKYDELSAKEKEEYEEKFGDPTTSEAPDYIESQALNSWLFNSDTVDKVLDYLMSTGIKVEGGDKIGKTIIFAKNQKHARFIEKRFDKNYPEHGGKFLRVIDNQESKAQDLLEKFSDKNQEIHPQIAVSVDMMDTGVDAVRVVNLVFFKPVRSSSKFWQMIGRGTRLCPDIFAPGEDKTHFLIFDFCENFEFFDQCPDGFESKPSPSISEQTFVAKLQVALLLREQTEKSPAYLDLAHQYIEQGHSQISALDPLRFAVKKKLRYLTEYQPRPRWENLSSQDQEQIQIHLAPLVLPEKGDDELARRFDLLTLNHQIALLKSENTSPYVEKFSKIARGLAKKEHLTPIAQRMPLIRQMLDKTFWSEINPTNLEEIRFSLRHLLKLLDREEQTDVYTHFEDEIYHSQIIYRDNLPVYNTLNTYRERVESYIRENSDHIVIHKLNTNKSITEQEINELERILFDGQERGTKKNYIAEYGERPLGEFIRSIVGLDTKAAHEVFADFIQTGQLNADQLTFIEAIITYLSKNGIIDQAMLFEEPFTYINDQGILGVFDESKAGNVISLIEHINGNARAI